MSPNDCKRPQRPCIHTCPQTFVNAPSDRAYTHVCKRPQRPCIHTCPHTSYTHVAMHREESLIMCADLRSIGEELFKVICMFQPLLVSAATSNVLRSGSLWLKAGQTSVEVRERERERESACVCVCVCARARACVRVRGM
jgi:hypothetical protein